MRYPTATASRLGHLGLAPDADANARAETDADLTGASSPARMLVVTAREDLAVLAEITHVLSDTSSEEAGRGGATSRES